MGCKPRTTLGGEFCLMLVSLLLVASYATTLEQNSDYQTCIDSPATCERLQLISRGITGTLPTELGLLTYMTDLYVQDNEITGSLPTELGLLTSRLYALSVYNNEITGTLPTELGQLASVYFIACDNAGLCGNVPTGVYPYSLVSSGWCPSGGTNGTSLGETCPTVSPTTSPTGAPTSVIPTTVSPTTRSPTTGPTTGSPTTRSPTTGSPTDSPTSMSLELTMSPSNGPTIAPTIRPRANTPTTHSPTSEAPSLSPTLSLVDDTEFLVNFTATFSAAFNLTDDIKMQAFYRDYKEAFAVQYPDLQIDDVEILGIVLSDGSVRSSVVFSSIAHAQVFFEAVETEPNLLLNSKFMSTYGVVGISDVSSSLIAARSHSSENTISPTPSLPDHSSATISQLCTVPSLVHAAALSVGIFLAAAIV